MSERMNSLERATGTILEPETEELTVFGRSTSTELDQESRAVVGYAKSSISLNTLVDGERRSRIPLSSGCSFVISNILRSEMIGW